MLEKCPVNRRVFDISVLWKGSEPINLIFNDKLKISEASLDENPVFTFSFRVII